ncbi:putative integral membrane protein [Encephalitozoon romaleae SJ-2008]|uniref:Integral membrane protein n=1 Tax=Encephalitozoon romaleae (strain SJ-2008) TaxID=1178016 RepID=I7ANE9_ENCRO|nr:putative integral membrane protein [Encephalitozoon romaleae SJ-2008]AFN83289.1 putative integral membrane protein [Encephalitozoon romaleae SJ-2008]
MDADSEVEFESFFQSSSNNRESEDSSSGFGSIQMSCDEMAFFSSDNALHEDNRAKEEESCESVDQGNQTFYDFNSDSSRIRENPEEEGCGDVNIAFPQGSNVLDSYENQITNSPRKHLSFDLDQLHVRHMDSGNAGSDTIFSGFTTGSRKKIQVRKESMDSAYRTFDGAAKKVDMQTLSRFYDISKDESEYMGPERVYEEIKRRLVKEDANRVFAQFTWSWIYFFFGRKKMEFDDLVDRIEEQVKVRLENEYSILRRIVEGDEVPWRYMILLVIGIDKERIEVFDGYYSLYALYDEPLRRKIEKKEIRVGLKLKIFGAELGGGEFMSIFDPESAFLRLHHNGVQVVHSRRRLGYRKRVGFKIRISDIRNDGGPVSCIEGRIAKIIETKYLVKVENYSCTTENLEPELDKIEELAKKAQRIFSSHDIRISMYTRLLVRDSSGECMVTWWNPSSDAKVGQMVRMVYLNPSRAKELHLNTSRRGYVKLLI